MLLLALFGLAVALVPPFRGRLSALAELSLRGAWLLAISLGIQLLIITVLPGPRTFSREVLYLASYVLAIVFLIINRRVPGLWLVGVGALMNLVAVSANGGVMPAAKHAFAVAGLPLDTSGVFANSVALRTPHLLFLGDIFAVPKSWPLHNVFSPGDICVAVGAAVTVHRATGSRLIPSGTGQFTSLMRHRSFMGLWGAQVVSNLGDWIYWLAVGIALSERVDGPAYARTLSILLICQFAPAAVFGALFVGPMVDRHSRRRLMIGADVLRGVAVASLLLSSTPSPIHFYVVAICLGLFGAVFQPSLLASVPNVVDRDQVVAANAMVAATNHIAIMIGPPLGGFLIGTIGPRPVFGINAASFILSATLILSARLPRTHRLEEAPSSAIQDLKEGLRYALRTPLVRGVLVVMGLVFLGAATKAPLEPLFVKDVLTKGAQVAVRARVLGMITMAWGLGMLLGAAGGPALTRRFPRERLLPVAIFVVGVAVLIVSRTADFSTVLLAWLFAGGANSLGNLSYKSLLQERTPDAMRGRVFAATEATSDGTYLAGAFLAGFLGSWLSVSTAIAISGAILLLAGAMALAMIPEPIARHPSALTNQLGMWRRSTRPAGHNRSG